MLDLLGPACMARAGSSISNDERVEAQAPSADTALKRKRRRWWISVLAAIALVAIVAAVTWFVALPRYRPSLHNGERLGVDVSVHQGHIDWNRVAGDGITFAYIKATEGGDFVDQRFAENWSGAQAAGIDRGAYHFFTFCRPGIEQADNFLRTVPKDASALLPAVDLEINGNCQSRPDRETVYRELNAFLNRVEASTGKATILYVGDDFQSRYPVRDNYRRPLWLLNFLRRPSENWTIWQVDGWARVDGISGSVDLDVMR
ncbi:MAG: lysozyme [Acidimicrobiaceae bacterium]|jgi:lysozyme